MQNKRLTITLTILLAIACASASLAFFPAPDVYVTFKMQMGWFEGVQVWYICTDTNDIGYASDQHLTLAPKLSSALGIAPKLWVVLNPTQTQGPVFSTEVGTGDYCGLWQIYYLTWQPGSTPRPLRSSGDVNDAITSGELAESETQIIVDYPIIAEGRLGGPWIPSPPGTYRLPQAKVAATYAATKLVSLPAFFVFCQDNTTHAVSKRVIIVPDAESPEWVLRLGANSAPGLRNIPEADTQALWYQPTGPQLCQLPVEEECPTAFSVRNTNFAYSPIERLVVLEREIPEYATVTNPIYIRQLLASGGLLAPEPDDQPRLNTPIVPWQGCIDFENAPDCFVFKDLMHIGRNIGGLYPGVTFGPNVVIYDKCRTKVFTWKLFPPHSGTSIAGNIDLPIFHNYIDVCFDIPVQCVCFWYAAACGLEVEAYNCKGALVAYSKGWKTMGCPRQMSVCSGNIDICRIRIHDTLLLYYIDDLCWSQTPCCLPY